MQLPARQPRPFPHAASLPKPVRQGCGILHCGLRILEMCPGMTQQKQGCSTPSSLKSGGGAGQMREQRSGEQANELEMLKGPNLARHWRFQTQMRPARVLSFLQP
jgi:hypothetical protein